MITAVLQTKKLRKEDALRWAEWYAAALFLVYAVLFFAQPSAPALTDYANWTYQGVLFRNHLLGLPDAAHNLKLYPVPNSASTLGIGLLSLLAPWKLAAKIWLCLQLLVSFIALRHFLRTIEASAALWLIAPTALFLNMNFWYGFMNFELGLCWEILIASLLLRLDWRLQTSWKQESLLGFLLLLAFFTHMIPFAFACLLVVLYSLQSHRYRLMYQIIPSAMLSLWYVCGRYLLSQNADGQAGMVASVRTFSGAFWAYKLNSYLKSFGFINPGSLSGSADITMLGRAVFMVLFLVNVALCAILGWYMVRAAASAFRHRATQRFVWWAIVLMLPLYLLLPGAALGVSDPGSRVLEVALALAILMIGKQGIPLGVAAACATLLALAGVFLFARLAFSPEIPVSTGKPLPHHVVIFGHVPHHDQDYFYTALENGDMSLRVFPTGMFLNQKQEPPTTGGAALQ